MKALGNNRGVKLGRSGVYLVRAGLVRAGMVGIALWVGNVVGWGAAISFESGDVNLLIPDNDASGIVSTINVSGVNDPITSVSVTLNLVANGGPAFNGDYYAYLSNDSNDGFAILLNRPGKTLQNEIGTDGAGFLNVTWADDAANGDIHNYEATLGAGFNAGDALTGTWPPDGRNVDPADVLDSDVRTALLDSFTGKTANGNWRLFLADVSTGGTLTLEDWRLDLQVAPVPEPAQ